MKQIVTTDDITQLGTILSIWAHPDDETFVAGGVLAAAVKNGQRVICVTATKGEKGVQDELRWPAAQLAEVRTKEMVDSLEQIGVSEHHWLDYRDGECAGADPIKAAAKIAKLINQYQPDTILTFGLDGLTGHPDHRTMSRWVAAAVKQSGEQPTVYRPVYSQKQYEQFLVPLNKKLKAFFNIDKPPLKDAQECEIAFELPATILQQKIRALAAQPSQMERLLKAVSPGGYKGTFGVEYFTVA